MLYKIFYGPVVKLAAMLVVVAGNLRCAGHGKCEYMQGRVLDAVREKCLEI